MPVESVYSWLQSETNSMMELSGMRVEVVGVRDGGSQEVFPTFSVSFLLR